MASGGLESHGASRCFLGVPGSECSRPSCSFLLSWYNQKHARKSNDRNSIKRRELLIPILLGGEGSRSVLLPMSLFGTGFQMSLDCPISRVRLCLIIRRRPLLGLDHHLNLFLYRARSSMFLCVFACCFDVVCCCFVVVVTFPEYP